MKVKCDLCGGILQVRKGGTAICTNCGLGYSMDRLREMAEPLPTTEELVSLFTRTPLNAPEDLLEDDPFDDFPGAEPEAPPPMPLASPVKSPPEVPLSSLLSTLKPPASTPYEVRAKPRDEPRLDLMAKACQSDSFLMLVDDVYSVGTVGADVIGTVDSGTVKPGDTVLINGGRPCEVMAIEHHGLRQEYAWKGMYASILLKGVDKSDLSRGDILTSAPADSLADTLQPPSKACGGRALDASDLIPIHSDQFVMEVTKATRRAGFRTVYLELDGHIKSGCVCNLDSVFVNGSGAHTWTVLCTETDPPSDYTRASAGMTVSLELLGDHKIDPNTVKTLVGEAVPEESLGHFAGTPRQFFNSLLVRQFHPKYEILTDVSYDGIPEPITYLFYQEDTPKLALFLLNSFDNKQRYRVEKAMKACKEAGIPALQFFMDYSNTAHYVSMRIRKALG